MIVVVDAGPVIHLSWIGSLDLLPRLFDRVLIPPAVRDEVMAAPADSLGLREIIHALEEGKLTVRTTESQPTQPDASTLGRGELQALVLASEAKADLFLSDDAAARKAASDQGLTVMGTLGVLIESRQRGLIDSVLPYVLELRDLGQWISDDLIDYIKKEEEVV
jgi:predicted nucleic acid-binding protein